MDSEDKCQTKVYQISFVDKPIKYLGTAFFSTMTK